MCMLPVLFIVILKVACSTSVSRFVQHRYYLRQRANVITFANVGISLFLVSIIMQKLL